MVSILTFDSEAIRALLEPYDDPDHSADDESWWAAQNSERPGPFTLPLAETGASLSDELESDIEYYLAMETDYGDFMVAFLEAILKRVRFTGARTVREHLDRLAAMDAGG